MMAPVVSTWGWVFVVPAAIVNRDSHFLWIAMVQRVAAAVVVVAVEVVGIVDVRIVVETVEVVHRLLATTPNGSVALLLGFC